MTPPTPHRHQPVPLRQLRPRRRRARRARSPRDRSHPGRARRAAAAHRAEPRRRADPPTYHWFTGTGMVHGVRLRDGRAEWYRNRFVRDDNVTEAKGWPAAPGPRHGMGAGTANTNVIGHAGRTFAIVEAGGLPVELTDELDTVQHERLRRHAAGLVHRAPEARPGDRRAPRGRLLLGVGPRPVRRRRHRRPRAHAPSTSRCRASRWCTTARSPSRKSSCSTCRSRSTSSRDERRGRSPTRGTPTTARGSACCRATATRRRDALVRGRPLLRVPPAERVRPAGRPRRVRRRAAPEDVRHRPLRPERGRADASSAGRSTPTAGTCARGAARRSRARSSRATTSASIGRQATATATPRRSADGSSSTGRR